MVISCVTIVTKHMYTYGKLFWFLIVFTWWTFWDHCQQNWSISICFTPVEPKTWPLTFSSISTKRYFVERSNYTFFWIVITRGICWYGFWKPWSNFWIWPLYKLSCDPTGFLYRVWPGSNMKWWSLDPYQHNKIIKPFVSFQLIKGAIRLKKSSNLFRNKEKSPVNHNMYHFSLKNRIILTEKRLAAFHQISFHGRRALFLSIGKFL